MDGYGDAILILTERSTNFLLMRRLPEGRKAGPTVRVGVRLLLPYREHVRTITMGLTIKGRPPITVYFIDSYCSWQKGAVKNANKLIRRYIPKSRTSTGLRTHTS